ncbi:Glycine/D-amino acid oxidase [Halobacillus dabanensis]|uniref:Glycine/D-amino acid oxidase n=1 Tax=Halobacillus dabanensis TaxID=240302 RepID=A0A1I3Q687_HALDA|nr:FAD-dependent oxidoreductase [Halobacillus dabanensis]SFJ29398.1 Glycine/D-amino acid oxidase [Halobacillus dabanensis]
MKDSNRTNTLPHYSSSYWKEHQDTPSFPSLKEEVEADVTVIGGGMAGILTSYLLSLEGKRVVLLEGSKLLDGTTGHTTAKISAQHDVMYDQLINKDGEEKARLYYEAQVEAMNDLKDLIDKHGIHCDYKIQDAYLHAGTERGRKQLEKEKEAYDKLNIDGEFLEETDLPFNSEAALVMKNQAHFHPVKFLQSIVTEIEKNGGIIYENSTAVDIKGKEPIRVETRDGYSITCNQAVMATHFPFEDAKGLYFSRLHPERSYTIAARTEKEVPDGMYLGIDTPAFSMRHTEVNGEKLAIIGGENHKTGKSENTEEHYKHLTEFAEEHFGVVDVPYKWSAQDLMTPDNIPFIGQSVTGRPNVYLATGFKKWGITNGMAAAVLLKDLITGKKNPYENLFDPTRSHLKREDSKNIIKEGLGDGAELVKSRLERGRKTDIEDLQNDEGAIVNVKGTRTGAYRNERGELHLVDSTCTHMKCGVEWNNAERSWDCPCHGSRFSVTGEVIEGPATKPLKKIELD